MSINGLSLFFSANEQNSVELIRLACEKSIRLMEDLWELDTPKDCRVYIMTSWFSFMFQSAPWPWKFLLAVTIPLWAFRAKKIWPLAGGWEQRYGQRRAVGVKPPRLLRLADRKMGDRIFVRREDVSENVQSITCHELTHAFTSHLQLPTWLNEGLAMVTVDKFFEESTVRRETLEMIEHSSDKQSPRRRQKPRVEDENALVYLYVRGYWLTRYIDETRPDLLKDLLSRRYRHDELEGKIAAAYGVKLEKFWSEIDGLLVSHFNSIGEAA
jgi:hypothetical protein